jgi:hypothetical protein
MTEFDQSMTGTTLFTREQVTNYEIRSHGSDRSPTPMQRVAYLLFIVLPLAGRGLMLRTAETSPLYQIMHIQEN